MFIDPSQEVYLKLIKDHEGIIHKVIGLYVDNSEDKRDLKQEILLQAWKGFKNFKSDSLFSTWLYKVALNTVLTFRKKVERKSQFEVPPAAASRSTEDHELLYLIIRSMNEIDRMLITLHLDGYKHKEVSKITGMTVNNVTVKIHRLKAEIIEKFKKMNHV